ncbi:unnamed protein product [Sphagnum jensenii]|uniref:MobA/MobL protein domain-containing protein n=1 Tax=Sphagnum jensenii TaxID=128206 RepID=A0ABP0VDY2_9BRYO
MAIFHLTHKFLKRSSGASSISKAAYNAGQKIEDNDGSTEYSDYTRKGGVLYDEIMLPSCSPSWANERGELWRRLEAREDKSTRRADAILAHNIDIALPHELTLEQNIFLAKDYVREQFTRKGYAVDWAIHSPDPRGDSRNIHLHILVPLRKIDAIGESFGIKDRYTKQQLSKKVSGQRSSWAILANRHLKRYGHKAAIDERSLKAQGHSRKPTKHRGIRPKSTRYQLDKMRAKQPPLPIAPIVRTTKQIHGDGTITIQRVIKHTALNNIRVGGDNKNPAPVPAPQPALNAQPKGWPPEAVAMWEAWGSRNPDRFFTVWPELKPRGFVAAKEPSL